MLLDMGADPGLACSLGTCGFPVEVTALTLACVRGHSSVVEKLVVKGADGQTRNVSLTVGEAVAPGVEIRRQRGTANHVVRMRLNWLNGRA